ncbi:MAG: N-acetyltransferase [Candidatus Coatesbacteria bacterium]|nr:N-acetyltransferase [Candidatus Coatesbacteria bacterium]
MSVIEPRGIDAGVIVGYRPGRNVEDLSLIIGPGAKLRSGTVIYLGSVIGSQFETGHNVVIREENKIGDRVSIWGNSVIDYGCRIGSDVKIHTGVYVAQFTTIEDDVFMAPGVQIANDLHPICTECMVGPTIKSGVRIGVNATILPRITIGENVLVGAGAVVVRDVEPGMVVAGSPARVIGRVKDLKCVNGTKGLAYPGLQ